MFSMIIGIKSHKLHLRKYKRVIKFVISLNLGSNKMNKLELFLLFEPVNASFVSELIVK